MSTGWFKVAVLHTGADAPGCLSPDVHMYAYRIYTAPSPSTGRCICLAWCLGCRTYASSLVHIPADEVLPDLFSDLPREERELLHRSEVKLLRAVVRRTALAGISPRPSAPGLPAGAPRTARDRPASSPGA